MKWEGVGLQRNKMAQGGAFGGTHLTWAKSYCPDYRNLPVTVLKLRSVEQSLQWVRL